MKKAILLQTLLAAFILMGQRDGLCQESSSDPVLRVCIADNAHRLHVILKDDFVISSIESGKKLMGGGALNATIRPGKKGGILVGRKVLRSSAIRIQASGDADIYINGRRFRGQIEVMLNDRAKLIAINHIPLEEYLYGVLYHEVSHRWPIEALKAQAIAARTFALYQARQNRLQPYDLRNDIYSQVYGGRTSEKWSTTKAVDLTRGEVLVFNGDIFPAYFHATCAGHTEDASNLWKIDLPPLKGVECGFCTSSPHFYWTKSLPLWQLASLLKKSGYAVGRIGSVTILSKNKIGRVEKLEIKDEEGVSVIITGKDFRQLIGPNDVRSTNFDTEIKWGELVMSGLGWGHGVGMCQWGVYGMSRRGKKAEEMLSYYYPGTRIVTIDKVKGAL